MLLISGKESRLYLGNTDHFVRIVTGTPESVAAYANDKAEKVANFSSEKLEDILNQITKKEFKFLEIIGGFFGFLIGLIQVLIQLLSN